MSVRLLMVFVSALIFDGLLLPAFFGFRESVLSLLVPIMLVLYMGCAKRHVIYGLSFFIVSELSRGLDFGTLAIPFLLVVFLVYFVQKFLDLKYMPGTDPSVNKSILFASASILFIFLFSTIYGLSEMVLSENEPSSFLNRYSVDLAVNLTTISEALLVIFVFDRIFSNKTHIYAK